MFMIARPNDKAATTAPVVEANDRMVSTLVTATAVLLEENDAFVGLIVDFNACLY